MNAENRTKKDIRTMGWGELPIWIYVLFALTTGSWFAMWVVKAYFGFKASLFFFGLWLLGTFAFVIMGMFFSYQYPRVKK